MEVERYGLKLERHSLCLRSTQDRQYPGRGHKTSLRTRDARVLNPTLKTTDPRPHTLSPQPFHPYPIYPKPYRCTSLTRKRAPLGLYSEPMPKVQEGPRGMGVFLWARYPCDP